MSHPVDSIEPKIVWQYFDKIRQIPRSSGNEQALAEAVCQWARDKGAVAEIDGVGNVVVRVPATPGHERAPTLVIQGHLDMVCEKNSDKEFDFDKDAIVLVRDGDWMTADGTTLGADNGIGVAIGLAFLDLPDAVHGPLELLFTVDEETGLNGAMGIQPGFLTGDRLVNLDSEEDGVFYVGCAGGRDARVLLPLEREPSGAGHEYLQLALKGLKGGHSGLDIIHNRGNALRLLARAIDRLGAELEARLVTISGGDKHNAIPREATAVVRLPAGSGERAQAILAECLAGFRSEFATAEPELTLGARPTDPPAEVLTAAAAERALGLLLGLPHGVIAMSRDLENLVETSTNLASARINGDTLALLTSNRSSNASALDGVIRQIAALARLAGAAFEPSAGYPGWQPNMDSPLLAIAKQVWTDVHGEEPRFTAIHAGLECGLIGEKFPGMDMISIGPTIVAPHSPDEKVSIPTIERLFAFVKALVAAVAREK